MIRKAAQMEVEVRDRMRGGPGQVTIRHFFKPAEMTARSRLCARLTIPAGAGIGLHKHDGEDEVYIVLKGSGLLDDGVTRTRVFEGDAILTGKGESHSILNDGALDLDLIAVIMLYAV